MSKDEGDDVTRLAREISDTLQRVISESPQVNHSLNRIRAEGYQVSLVLEATIGLSQVEGEGQRPAPPAEAQCLGGRGGPRRGRRGPRRARE